jgi:RimJ/RimL family protein N-acetyltransferase
MSVTPIEFKTQRLSFGVWEERHRAPFAAMNADPEVMRFFPALLTAEQSDAMVDRIVNQFPERGWGLWAVEIRSSGEFIGFIGLAVPRYALPFGPCVEVGWRLRRSARGHGYATEGGQACLGIAFDRLGLNEIVSFTALTNLPSIAVMKRIGLSNAGTDFDHPGVPEDNPLRRHCLYRISRDDWLGRRAYPQS